MPTDEKLIRQIKRGSEEAMEILVKKYYNHIFAYVYRTVGDYHLAYDLTQEVFMKMLQSIQRYKGKGKFENWLITIAVNHCRDFFRSKSFQQKSLEQELLKYVPDKRKDALDLLTDQWESKQVKKALEKLPLFQREPIILRFYHDYQMKEIAEITESNESTVKSRIRQGIFKLKQLLERRDFGDENNEKRSNYT